MILTRKTFSLLVLLVLLVPMTHAATTEQEIKQILAHPKEPPAGVVFEIVEGDEAFLEWGIPQIKKYARQLREVFPGLNIAVVSHGREEFALMKSNQKKYSAVHKEVKSLVNSEDIPVHVCGTHASWYGHDEEDFPEYVDVAPVGPAQINDYENMGYTLIVLEKP